MRRALLVLVAIALLTGVIVWVASLAGEHLDNCPTEALAQEQVHPDLKEEVPEEDLDTGVPTLTCTYHTPSNAAERVDVIVEIFTFGSGHPPFANASRSQHTTKDGGYLIVSYLPVEDSPDQPREEVELGYPHGSLLCVATITRPRPGDRSMEEAADVLAKEACNRAS